MGIARIGGVHTPRFYDTHKPISCLLPVVFMLMAEDYDYVYMKPFPEATNVMESPSETASEL